MAGQPGPTKERLELAARVAELRAAGLKHREVAAELGISRSYASVLAVDPEGEQQRRRRDTYTGACALCGGETRSNGTSQASRLCGDCARTESQKWTPELVIAAIQAFHAAHGRSPSATEWLSHPPEGCPYTSTVITRFGKWADGIVAAGFPRPRAGVYVTRERGIPVEYFVFRLNGTAELLGKTDAHTAVEAIGNLADAEGQYGAISVSQIQVRDVKQQLSVVKAAAK